MKLSHVMRRAGRFGFTGVLTTGVISAFGILSVTGAALLHPGFGLLVASFVFGGMAEGEVYFQEIREGLKDLAIMGKRGTERLAIRSLDRQLMRVPPAADTFLAQYVKLKQHCETLRGKQKNEQIRTQKALAKKRLAMMEKYLAARVMGKKAKLSFEDEGSTEILENLKNEQPRIRRKMHFLRASIPVGLVCGSGFGLVAAGLLSSAIAGVTITGLVGVLSAMVWPLAVAAAIGAFFLMVHTVKEFIFSDFFSEWQARIKRWYQPEGKVTSRFIAKAAGLTLVLGGVAALCVLATLGTFGMCWPAAQLGLKLIPHLVRAAKWIRAVVIPVYVAGTFVFTSFKSLETLQMIENLVRGEAGKMKARIQAAFNTVLMRENKLQIADPFRAISIAILYTVNFFLWLGHVVASGAGSNQFKGISPVMLTVAAASNEGFQDAPFFFAAESKTLISRIAFLLLSPVLLLSAVWQRCASRLNQGDSVKPCLTFKDALKQAFHVKSDNHAEAEKPLDALPDGGAVWKKQEIEKRVMSAVRKCRITKMDTNDLKQVVNTLLASKVSTPDDNASVSKNGMFALKTVSEHPRFNAKLEKLERQYGLGR